MEPDIEQNEINENNDIDKTTEIGKNTESGKCSGKRKHYIVFRIFMWLLLCVGILAVYLLRWSLDQYGQVPFEQVIFHLRVPLEGASHSIVAECVLGFFKVAVAPLLLWGVALIFLPWPKHRVLRWVTRGIIIGADVVCLFIACRILGIPEYLDHQLHPTRIYEDYYVDPQEVSITFPEEKKNIIYLYLESMEVSYASKEFGGALVENHIPNLTKLSLMYEDFSGIYLTEDEANAVLAESESQFSGDASTSQIDDAGIETTIPKINGAYATKGATWTVGAMVAQTTGLPLSIPINVNTYGKYKSFLPGATALGDILEQEGYNQMLMIGSKASFGGRDDYFTQHGHYGIYDYNHEVKIGKIDEDYYENWGVEDEKLFSYAKEELTRLAGEDEPFNFTLLTVDTHFPNGYICRLCDDQFETDMENAIACSDAQVADFVQWITEQDFYENTVIIIAGDHENMGNVMKNVINDSTYERKTNFIIMNSQVEEAQNSVDELGVAAAENGAGVAARIYTTMDIFPTTLAAMGCTIEGDRLGLGTNLYSNTQTVVEILGIQKLNEELGKASLFYDNEILQE